MDAATTAPPQGGPVFRWVTPIPCPTPRLRQSDPGTGEGLRIDGVRVTTEETHTGTGVKTAVPQAAKVLASGLQARLGGRRTAANVRSAGRQAENVEGPGRLDTVGNCGPLADARRRQAAGISAWKREVLVDVDLPRAGPAVFEPVTSDPTGAPAGRHAGSLREAGHRPHCGRPAPKSMDTAAGPAGEPTDPHGGSGPAVLPIEAMPVPVLPQVSMASSSCLHHS